MSRPTHPLCSAFKGYRAFRCFTESTVYDALATDGRKRCRSASWCLTVSGSPESFLSEIMLGKSSCRVVLRKTPPSRRS